MGLFCLVEQTSSTNPKEPPSKGTYYVLGYFLFFKFLFYLLYVSFTSFLMYLHSIHFILELFANYFLSLFNCISYSTTFIFFVSFFFPVLSSSFWVFLFLLFFSFLIFLPFFGTGSCNYIYPRLARNTLHSSLQVQRPSCLSVSLKRWNERCEPPVLAYFKCFMDISKNKPLLSI